MHKRLSEGDKHEQKEAVADFISDEYFDNWYEETLTKLQAYEDGQIGRASCRERVFPLV